MKQVLNWLTQTLSQIPQDDAWLSEAERRVLARMRFPKKRDDWKLGRWTAKQAICAVQIRESPVLSDLEIRAAADGAPEAFWKGEPAQVSISISHSRRKSLCVIGPSGCSVGCDLEWIEPREPNFAGDYFSAEEISVLQEAPADLVLPVNLIWSAKETVLKILRQGLRLDARSVTICPDFRGLEAAWKPWTGHCLESTLIIHGWWRACEGFIYTAASDRVTSAPNRIRIAGSE